jgi:biotin carboxylase
MSGAKTEEHRVQAPNRARTGFHMYLTSGKWLESSDAPDVSTAMDRARALAQEHGEPVVVKAFVHVGTGVPTTS